jgi:hypothetical protein
MRCPVGALGAFTSFKYDTLTSFAIIAIILIATTAYFLAEHPFDVFKARRSL